MPAHKVPLEERFWAKVDKNGPTMPHMDSECWVWVGAKSRGYGTISVNEKTEKAHRVAMKIQGIPLEDDELSCHHCDNAPCVRGEHLYAGTYKDNNHDKTSKGRHPNSQKQQCKRKHWFTPSNTFVNTNGARQCWICTEFRYIIRDVERNRKP